LTLDGRAVPRLHVFFGVVLDVDGLIDVSVSGGKGSADDVVLLDSIGVVVLR
jgi:hypothetical protein